MLGWEVIPRIPLGDFSVSPHGVGIAVGYFIGATLMARRARRTGFDEDHAWNAAVVGVIGAIVGARIAYVVGHSDQFESAIEYLQIYRGGISLVGGLIGGFLAAWLYARSKKLDFARLADLGAPGLAIGTAVGRIGDLIIGDHLGKPTDGFWGWEYKGGELISSPPCLQGGEPVYPSANGCIEPGMVVHQTALYDAVWALVIFFILLRLDRKPRPKGFLVWTWAALYAAGRIVTDFTRVDKTWFGTGMTGSQLTAIAVLLVALAALARLRRVPAAVTAGVAAGETPDGAGTAAEPVPAVAAEAAAGGLVTEPVEAPAGGVAAEPVEAPAGGVVTEPVEAPAGGVAAEPAEAPGPPEEPPDVAAEPEAALEASDEPPGVGAPTTAVASEASAEQARPATPVLEEPVSALPAEAPAAEPPVAEELAGAGATSAFPAQEPPVADDADLAVGAAQEPPVAEELAGAAEVKAPATPEPTLAGESAGSADLINPEEEPAVAPVLVPEAGLDVGESAAPESEAVVENGAAGEPVTADPAVQGERVAEGEAEAPQAPEAVPALEPVLEGQEPASADEVKKDAPQEP